MIEYTQRRLTIRFTLILGGFTLLIFVLIFLYFHHSIMKNLKMHLSEEIQREFIDQYHRSGLDTFKAVWDEYHFQILNTHGDVVIASKNAENFYLDVNKRFLARAFAGGQVFEKVMIKDESYLMAYFPLSDKYAGRAAAPLHVEIEHEQGFLKILYITFPGMLIIAYIVSRYLVKQAMKPISDVLTFQENFSSNVTHELRSPLASLKGNFEVSLRKERSIDDYRETIRDGLTEVDRIINLLNDLYLLASSEFKPLDLFREQVDIKKMIEEVVNKKRLHLQSKKIRIDNSVAMSSFCICDEGLIRRVFENVINNAGSYTPQGGTIAISAFGAMGKILVNVSNTCKSMTSDEIKYFFEPFYRGKNVSNEHFDGKGLGLFIARYIVRSHGGDITAKIDGNTTFSLTISLPTG